LDRREAVALARLCVEDAVNGQEAEAALKGRAAIRESSRTFFRAVPDEGFGQVGNSV